MNLNERIRAFVNLGKTLGGFHPEKNSIHKELCYEAALQNPWFVQPFIKYAIHSLSQMLVEDKLLQWTERYQGLKKEEKKKNIGVVMAGNIPLAGFHDMLCVLLSGNIFIGKMSSKDNRLPVWIKDLLTSIHPDFNKRIVLLDDGHLKNIDAVIATGSNNTSRYFHYYFSKYPNIIRKHRNSVAVLTGSETPNDLRLLTDDIFLYFGMGCRNVSCLRVPENYCFDAFFDAVRHYSFIRNHHKYANNYEYNYSVLQVNKTFHLDNGFVMLKKEKGYSSPVSVLYYDIYKKSDILEHLLRSGADMLQCVVSLDKTISGTVPFGKSQQPEAWDYADGADTMNFLLNLK